MSLVSRYFGGVAAVALLFTVGCSTTADSPEEKPAATSEETTTGDENTDEAAAEQVSLWVTGYMSANNELTSLEIELPDGSHINLVPAEDVSYYLNGASITPAEAVTFYQNREDLVFVALDTWELVDPMDVSDGDVYTTANFTGGVLE